LDLVALARERVPERPVVRQVLLGAAARDRDRDRPAGLAALQDAADEAGDRAEAREVLLPRVGRGLEEAARLEEQPREGVRGATVRVQERERAEAGRDADDRAGRIERGQQLVDERGRVARRGGVMVVPLYR